MTDRSAFSDEEWELVALTPVVVGLAVAKAGRSGLAGSVRETRAIVDTIGRAEETHATNELIGAIVADHHYPGNELIRTAMATALEYQLERVADLPSSAEAAAQAAVEDCVEVADLLDQRATGAEAADYRAWLLEVAERVANAATEHGETVSAEEQALIQQIATALDR